MKPRRSLLPPMPQLRPSHAPGWVAISRGAAAGLALLLTCSLAEQRQWGTSLIDGWLFSLAPLPATAALALTAFAIPLLLLFTVAPGMPGPLRAICFLTILACCGFCGRDVWLAAEQTSEQIRSAALARPLGLLLILAVTGLGVVGCGSPAVRGRSSWFAMLLAAGLTVATFPVLSIQSDAVRPVPADCRAQLIVVPLCPNSESGDLSEALRDRLQTAAAELQRHPAARLLLCRMQQTGTLPEASQLRSAAELQGIAEDRLLIDAQPLPLPALLQQYSAPTATAGDQPPQVLLVSHWYELSRLRLLTRRAGLRPVTAAARQRHALFRQNQLIAAETLLLLRDLAMPAVEFARQSRVASETRLGEDPGTGDDTAEPFTETPAAESDAEAWLNENLNRLQPKGDGDATPAPQ